MLAVLHREIVPCKGGGFDSHCRGYVSPYGVHPSLPHTPGRTFIFPRTVDLLRDIPVLLRCAYKDKPDSSVLFLLNSILFYIEY